MLVLANLSVSPLDPLVPLAKTALGNSAVKLIKQTLRLRARGCRESGGFGERARKPQARKSELEN